MKWIKATFNADMILYFDPDIKVFSSLAYIEGELEKYAVVLTPHIYKPISEDEFFPPEKLFLQYGIYNLGFIGISFINNEVFDFLEWWEERLMKHCFIDIRNGLFVDQLPITFVTVFFSTISKVLFHYGLNVAPWNLHEREISMRNSEYYSNGDKLVFFHFSNICFSDGKHPVYNRYEVYPVLEQLFEQYRQELLDNSFHELKSLKPYYRLRPIEEGLFRRIGKFIMRHIRKQT
jgi:hypothetical protein